MSRRAGSWKLAAALVLLALGLETASWLTLTLWFKLRPSDNPRVAEYMRRGHPLITDNEDLRAGEIGIRFDPQLGYRLLPEYVYPRTNPVHPSRIETDAAGFVHNGDPAANPRLLADPKVRAYRIVVLGCSSVFGTGTSTNTATLPARLEARLRARWPDVALHVINAGVFGYNSAQERLYYEFHLRRLRPDAVVAVTGNCDAKYSAQLAEFQPQWSASLPLDRDSYLDHFRPARSARMFLANLLRFPEPLYTFAVLHRLTVRFGGGISEARRPSYHYHPEATRLFARNVEGLARILRWDGVLGLFALQPHLGGKRAELGAFERRILEADRPWVEALERHQQDAVQAFAGLDRLHAGQGLAFADFSAAFDGHSEATYETFTHFNDPGNAILAERIEDRFAAMLEADLRAKGWRTP
jgi:lysophospholipase L1-like esterase